MNTPPVTVDSGFSYTPPQSEAPPAEQAEFAQSLKDVIGEIENEWQSGQPGKPQVDLEDPAAEQNPEVTPTETPADPAVSEDPAVARGMDRLIQREVALQAREARFQASEGEITGLRQELAALKGRMPTADMQDKLVHSPSEVIKALGHDPKMVVRLMLAEQMRADGQEVPPALQEFVNRASTMREQANQRAELQGLKSQLAERDRLESATQFFNGVATGAKEYVTKSVVESKNMPTLAAIAKANPDRAHREIMEEITNDARNRAATDPNGEPLTYELAAKKVEARLSDWKSLLVQTPSGATQAQPGQNTKIPPSTNPAVVQPPAKPLKPWETPVNDIYKQGVAEAEREFYRAEQARLARR